MTLEAKTKERLGKYKRDPEYQAEKLSLAVTEELARVMKEKGISKKDLAERLGVSKARVSNILNGSPNLTLKTLASVGVALDSEVRFEVSSRSGLREALLGYRETLPEYIKRTNEDLAAQWLSVSYEIASVFDRLSTPYLEEGIERLTGHDWALGMVNTEKRQLSAPSVTRREENVIEFNTAA